MAGAAVREKDEVTGTTAGRGPQRDGMRWGTPGAAAPDCWHNQQTSVYYATAGGPRAPWRPPVHGRSRRDGQENQRAKCKNQNDKAKIKKGPLPAVGAARPAFLPIREASAGGRIRNFDFCSLMFAFAAQACREVVLDKEKELVSIGQAAKKAGVSRQSLQYYLMIGLLEPTKTTPTGRRLFDRRTIEQIRLIHRLNESGYPLRAIRELFMEGRS